MKRNKFAQVYICGKYKGVIEVVNEQPNFYEFVEVGHGTDVMYLPKREEIKVIPFEDVEVLW